MLVTLFLLFTLNQASSIQQMTVAGVFDEGDNNYAQLFRMAVDDVNNNRMLLPGVSLHSELVFLRPDDSFTAELKTCHLLEKGIVGIFGPRSPVTSEHIRSIADNMDVPFIETRPNYNLGRGHSYVVNIHPDVSTLSSVYLDLLDAYDWKTVTILYQDNNSLIKLKRIFHKTAFMSDKFRLIVKQLRANSNGYRDVLRETYQSKSKLILLDCEREILPAVLKQSQQVGLISNGYSFLLTSLDSHTLNMEQFKHGGTNFSWVSLVDNGRPEVSGVAGVLGLTGLDTTSALLYDAVITFSLALTQLRSVQEVTQTQLDCSGQHFWSRGNSLTNYMKMVEFVGLTGPVSFDSMGKRSKFSVDVMKQQPGGQVKTGSWNSVDRLELTRAEQEEASARAMDPMANKTFVITSILNPPYTMLVESSQKLSGNDRFEGFAIDLANELSSFLGFNFTFKLVDDGKYGSEISPGHWNGMLGEIEEEVADFCIADISITSARANSFSFSTPWMNLGISILYVMPTPAPPSLLAFLDPFSSEVYVFTLIVFVMITLLIYVLARFSPGQWEEPSSCVREPEFLTNQYNLINSFWFTLGAIMQQGSDVVPLSLCVRFASGMWFFFALILISSYTANLAAFLTVETLHRPIESVEDLANQNVIKYGAVKGGSTAAFFRNSNNAIQQRLWSVMDVEQDSVMVSSNSQGVEMVEESDGKYAFFMESSSIEYLVERRCKLSQVGGLLDSKGYGIATKKGTQYKALLDYAILRLVEQGTLHKLKIKWWKQKRGGGACEAETSGGGVKPLGLSNVAGVFLVTMLGCLIAAVFAFTEFLYGSRQTSELGGVSWLQEIRGELQFIFSCVGNTKIRSRVLPPDESSSSSFASASASSERSFSTQYLRPPLPPTPRQPPSPGYEYYQHHGEK